MNSAAIMSSWRVCFGVSVLNFMAVLAGRPGDPDESGEADIPVVNGFVRLAFYPLPLAIPHRSVALGEVNVSIETGYEAPQYSMEFLHMESADTSVASLLPGSEQVIHLDRTSWSVFNVTLYGNKLGQTSLKFYFSTNHSGFRSHSADMRRTLDTPQSSKTGTTAFSSNSERDSQPVSIRGQSNVVYHSAYPKPVWIPTEYVILVKHPGHWIERYLDYVTMAMVTLNMIGIGGQMDVEQILCLVKKPVAITAALLCRFGVMPALGLGLVEMLKPGHGIGLGVLSLVSSPSEGASCLLCMLAEVDLSLSVTVATINNFATVAMLPLWTIAFETRLYHKPGQAQIPFRQIFIIFSYVASGSALGYQLRMRCPKLYHGLWVYQSAFASFTLLFMLSVDVYKNDYIFQLISLEVFFIGAMLAAAGYLFGCAVAFIFRLPLNNMVVVAIETGSRTMFITCLLLSRSLPEPENDIAKATPVLSGLFAQIPCLVVILVRRGLQRCRVKGYPRTECSLMDSREDLTDAECGEEVTEAKETAM